LVIIELFIFLILNFLYLLECMNFLIFFYN